VLRAGVAALFCELVVLTVNINVAQILVREARGGVVVAVQALPSAYALVPFTHGVGVARVNRSVRIAQLVASSGLLVPHAVGVRSADLGVLGTEGALALTLGVVDFALAARGETLGLQYRGAILDARLLRRVVHALRIGRALL